MGKYSRKGPGRDWWSTAKLPTGPLSRQQQREVLRRAAWLQMSRPPMRDEGGIIPRWIRRSMALGLARKMWRATGHLGGPVEPSKTTKEEA